MIILLLFIIHSAQSVDECSLLEANCIDNEVCDAQLKYYLSQCINASTWNEECARIESSLLDRFGQHCVQSLVARAEDNNDCDTARKGCVSRRVKRSGLPGKILNGVSVPLNSLPAPDIPLLPLNSDMLSRGTRSPMSEQIRHWKNQLSEELQIPQSLDKLLCNRVLYELCLKHVSCRQLWNIFRTSCAVDASNQCIMTNREDCWQSFEGISWTGLGNCTCYGKDSDCQWIRLQTRYNKCIYEISASGDMPTSTSFLSRDWTAPGAKEIPERFQISSDHYRPSSTQIVSPEEANPHHTDSSQPSRSNSHSGIASKHSQLQTASGSLLSEDSLPLQYNSSRDRLASYFKPLFNATSPHTEENSQREQSVAQLELPPTTKTATDHSSDLISPSIERNDTDNRFTDVTANGALTPSSVADSLDRTALQSSATVPARQSPNSTQRPSTRHYQTTRQPSHASIRAYSTRIRAPSASPNPNDSFSARNTSSGRNSQSHHQTTRSRYRYPLRTQQAPRGNQQRPTLERNKSSFADRKHTKDPVGVSLTHQGAVFDPVLSRGRGRGQQTSNQTLHDEHPKVAQQMLKAKDGKSSYHSSDISGVTTEKPVTNIPRPPTENHEDALRRTSQDGTAHFVAMPSAGKESKASIETNTSPDQFRQFNSSASTCVAAHHRCERFDSCKWHLSEVQIRCTGHCDRHLCAAAIQRFTRYVARPSVESLMFCHCDLSDKDCLQHQQVMYPRCLYSDREAGPLTCTEAVDKCRLDGQCQRFSSIFFDYCPVSNNQCAISQMDHCRQALIAVRGTYLEYPCYCPHNDPVCRKYLAGMLPNNPCIERSMIEYSKMMSDANPEPGNVSGRIIANERDKDDEGRADEGRESHPSMITPQSTPPARWMAGASTHIPSNNNHRDSTQSGGHVTNVMPNSVSRISLDHKHYYESAASAPSSKTDGTHGSEASVSEKTRGHLPLSPSNKDNERPEETHRGDDDAQSGRAASTGHKTRPLSSPHIVGTTFLSPGDESSHADTSSSSFTSTPTAFVLVTQKHRNTTETARGAKGSTKTRNGTTRIPVRPTTSGPYITHAPPPLGGCTTKDTNGNVISHFKGSIIRRNHDWAGRCSAWCSCSEEEQLSCSKLPCLPDGECAAPLTQIEHGGRLYIKDRGACTCQSGVFICDQPEKLPPLAPGIYLLVGYSLDEVAMLKDSVPKSILERSGFLSEDAFVAHDIGSRLQIALERIMPANVQCRIMFLDEFEEEGNIIFQMEWFGVNPRLNETTERWHTGQAEKVCSRYVIKLTDAMSRNQAVRFQLVLSTVKQIRVLDLLDGLPSSAIRIHLPLSMVMIIVLVAWLLV